MSQNFVPNFAQMAKFIFFAFHISSHILPHVVLSYLTSSLENRDSTLSWVGFMCSIQRNLNHWLNNAQWMYWNCLEVSRRNSAYTMSKQTLTDVRQIEKRRKRVFKTCGADQSYKSWITSLFWSTASSLLRHNCGHLGWMRKHVRSNATT